MTMLSEVGTYLDGIAGLSLTLGTNLFLGHLPAGDIASTTVPDLCVALYATGGVGPGEHFGVDDEQSWDDSSLQVVVRGAAFDYATPEAKADAIRVELYKVANEDLSGQRYLRIVPADVPFLLRRDESERVYIASNYRVMRRP